MNTVNQSMYEWNAIPWRKLEREVFKLQKRIYQASTRGNLKSVHRLQRLLLSSRAAKLLAVRKVTQDNQGKRTAGVDGVKSLNPNQRLALSRDLKLTAHAAPLRRIWIPKTGTTELRPLGIPTLRDRGRQALAKIVLEPEWEAKFAPHTYGFRPGRSCHDAVQAIFSSINKDSKWVLDADIKKCYDRINHSTLLNKLHTFGTLRRAIRAWLKSGVMEGNELFPTREGVPQGGVISPLLANIALHGLEEYLDSKFPASRKINGRTVHVKRPRIIVYADDFVILHRDKSVVEKAKALTEEWLRPIGLELKIEKTSLVHTLEKVDEKVGFDFLGFHIRQYRVGSYKSGKMVSKLHNTSKKLGFKTFIKPSKKSVAKQYRHLAEIITTHKAVNQGGLINHLNPVIKGWSRYFSTTASKSTLGLLDNKVIGKLKRWAKRRHPNKSRSWVSEKYWHPKKTLGYWSFQTDQTRLFKHSETPIIRHTQIKGNRSPFDGDFVYWSTRLGKYPLTDVGTSKLLKRQKGRCNLCELNFRDGDLMEIDHIKPLNKGGGNAFNNLQLLHRHCHDSKSAYDKGPVVEEPDE